MMLAFGFICIFHIVNYRFCAANGKPIMWVVALQVLGVRSIQNKTQI
jgi:hypothetical protein